MAELYSVSMSVGISGEGVRTQNKRVTRTCDRVDNVRITVAPGEDVHIDFEATLANLVYYSFVSSKALKVETNSSVGTGTAGDTLTLVADEPAFWMSGLGMTKHFVSNITSLYLTNTGTANAILDVTIGKNITL